MSVAYWVCTVITIVSAAVSFYYSIAGLRTAAQPVRLASQYAFARSAALLAVAIVAPFCGSVGFVAAVALAMILVQAIDAVIGVGLRDLPKSVGPASTALFNLAALVWLLAT